MKTAEFNDCLLLSFSTYFYCLFNVYATIYGE